MGVVVFSVGVVIDGVLGVGVLVGIVTTVERE